MNATHFKLYCITYLFFVGIAKLLLKLMEARLGWADEQEFFSLSFYKNLQLETWKASQMKFLRILTSRKATLKVWDIKMILIIIKYKLGLSCAKLCKASASYH